MAAPDRHAAPFGLHLTVLLASQLAIGSAALMARAGLQAGLSPLALSAWRLTLASIVLVVVLVLVLGRKDSAPLSRQYRIRLIFAGVLLGLHFAAWFASLQYVSVARSTLLVTSAPLWAGLAGRFLLRQKTPMTFWAGLGVALFGAYLVTQTGLHVSTHYRNAALGDGLAVAGAISVAGYLLLVQDLQHTLGTWRVVAWTYSAAAVSLWLAVLATEPMTSAMPHGLAAWLSVIGMALFPQLIGHTSLNWSLKRFTAGAVAAATLLEPVFAGTLAWIFLDESLTVLQIIGAAILLCGVGLALWRSGRSSISQIDGVE